MAGPWDFLFSPPENDNPEQAAIRARVAAVTSGPPGRTPTPMPTEQPQPRSQYGVLGPAASVVSPPEQAGVGGTASGPETRSVMDPATEGGVVQSVTEPMSGVAGMGAGAGNNAWSVTGHPGDVSEDVRGAAGSALGTATGAYGAAAVTRRQAAKERRAAISSRIDSVSKQIDTVSKLLSGESGRLPAALAAVDAIKSRVNSELDAGTSYEDAWKNMGSARRVAGALGMAMGAFTEGWTQGRVKNAAASMIDKAIAQDVADKKQQLKYHLDKLSLSSADYERIAQKIDAHVSNLSGLYKNVFDLKMLESAAMKGDAAAMENFGGLILKSVGDTSKIVDKFSPKVSVSGKKVPGTAAALKGVAQVGAGSLAPKAPAGMEMVPVQGEPPSGNGILSNPYGKSSGQGSDLLSNPYEEQKPNKAEAALGSAIDRPVKSNATQAVLAPRKVLLVPAKTRANPKTGKEIVVDPGSIRINGKTYRLGTQGRDMDAVDKDVKSRVTAYAGTFSRMLDLIQHGVDKWGSDQYSQVDLVRWAKSKLPGTERYYNEVAAGLGVLMAVAIQGARPADEEQRIFGNWQIKSVDGYMTAKKKIYNAIAQMSEQLDAEVSNYPPDKFYPEPFRIWSAQLEKFKAKADREFRRFEKSKGWSNLKEQWKSGVRKTDSDSLNSAVRRAMKGR